MHLRDARAAEQVVSHHLSRSEGSRDLHTNKSFVVEHVQGSINNFDREIGNSQSRLIEPMSDSINHGDFGVWLFEVRAETTSASDCNYACENWD
jgi:hypothetical protein